MKFFSVVCFVLVAQICSVIVKSQYIGRPCVINNILPGECKSIYNCPQALHVFNRRPLERRVIENMKKIQCGFDRFTPLVCCSDDLNLEELPNNHLGPIPPSRPTRPPVRPTRPRSTTTWRTTGWTSSGRSEDLLPDRDTCGQGILHDKVYGGQLTELDEFPWMVLLGYRNATGSRVFQCGGVLISKRYILTAAHCVTGEITRAVGRLEVARLGEYDIQTSTDCVGPDGYEQCAPPHQDIRVEKMIPHKGFSDRNINRKDDIALVRLSRDVQFTQFVQPICLPNTYTRNLVNDDSVYVAGWGKTLREKSSNVKLKLVLPIYDKNRCQSLFSSTGVTLTPAQICAGGESEKDACRGDSGGPLMREEEPGLWVTMGIVSFGFGCGQAGWPGIYTNVSSYMDWIKSNMEF